MGIKVSKFIKKKLINLSSKRSFEVSHTKNIYNSVCKKVENFFYEENYLNIDSAIVFGY